MLTQFASARPFSRLSTSYALGRLGWALLLATPWVWWRSEDTYSYDYNARDELVRAENGTGVVTLTYDAFGRITSETVNGETMAYQYNAEDEMTQLDGLGISQTQSYDIKGLLSQLDVDGTLYQYTYDALDRLTTLDRNAADSSLTYDDANQLSQISHGSGHRSYDYEYDAVSRVSEWQGVADESRGFEYDNAGRLISVQSPSQPETFNYDALGNRLNNNAQYDAANRLLEDDNHQYSYDINGNRIRKTDKVTGEVERYTYNSLDQLVGYRSYPNADTDAEPVVDYSYTYGPLGRRWSKQNNFDTETTAFYWSGTSLIGETNNGTERRYILEGLTPVGFVENNETYHYLRDHIGTAHEIIDSNGAMVWQADYRSFGNLTRTVNTVENNLRFAGQYEDQENGLYHNQSRYYDPNIGQYVQSDTLGLADGVNTYTYVNGNPLTNVDPTGEFAWGLAFAGADLAWQLYQNGGDLSCVNWAGVGMSMLGGGLLNGLMKGAFKFKTVGSHTWSATRKWMTRNNIMPNRPGIQRHHWLFERNQGIGRHVPDAIKNQPWNINPIPSSYNNWLGRSPWRAPLGAPSWAAETAGGAGMAAAGAAAGSDCDCN